MKNTIRNFRSAFIKLIFLSYILVGFSNKAIGTKNEEVNSNGDSLVKKNIKQTIFYSNYNQPETFSNAGNYFIVLKNNRNCIDCFRVINEFVSELKKIVNAEFIVIALIDSTTLDRKRNYYSNKNLMPDFDKYSFQYRNSYLSTILAKPETTYTPEIILIKKGNVMHLPYQNVFEYQSLNMSEKVQQEIIDFLK